jgi:hypothetical protein
VLAKQRIERLRERDVLKGGGALSPVEREEDGSK